jgi:hypothetical protein
MVYLRGLERAAPEKVDEKSEGAGDRPPRIRLPKVDDGDYFFFDEDFLLPPFFEEEEDLPPFLAAIQLTTFHAVRDLPVALTWQDSPECSGNLNSFW